MALQKNVLNFRAVEKDFSFSQAVRAGNLLFVSGCVSWDENANPVAVGDMAAQMDNVYKDLGRTLAAYNLTFNNVVKETMYTRDMDAMVGTASVRAGYYADCAPPASTWIEISRLVHPDLLLEVEIVATFD
ncbi:RidA family protein (plasmid) [Sphingomonas paeninsulae]|uniref:RidA family protein n=1 Tax=Sphingomonas paeninsulae TaxID=2319844 RepID=A0A494THR1_SPHPE|nr:RidA family protein [Sphingomonas paeninsulae]AYJ84968.1 RidA family protein [Sphingomonas paeninsulae]